MFHPSKGFISVVASGATSICSTQAEVRLHACLSSARPFSTAHSGGGCIGFWSWSCVVIALQGKLHPCAFFSHLLLQAEQNYNVGDKELLTIKLGLEEWRHWLDVPTTVCGRVIWLSLRAIWVRTALCCSCNDCFGGRLWPEMSRILYLLALPVRRTKHPTPVLLDFSGPCLPPGDLVAHRTGLYKWGATVLM